MVFFGLLGDVIDQPVVIDTPDGKALGTSLLTLRVYYLDQNTSVRSILVPLVIQLNDENKTTFSTGYNDESVKPSRDARGIILPQYIKDEIEIDAAIYKGHTGKRFDGVMNFDSVLKSARDKGHLSFDLYDLIGTYSTAWKAEMDIFTKTGDITSLKFIFSQENHID